MPNWCNNFLNINHEDRDKVTNLVKELEKGNDSELFNHLCPSPSGEWDYDWSVANWGTKWDARVYDWSQNEDGSIDISFDTAWSQPTALYYYLTEEGWDLNALFHEEGMCFCGSYTNEDGEDFYEYDPDDLDSIADIPSEIEEFANLTENYHMRHEDSFDDEDDEE